nr:reverse transcriptase domain-containing protein [Tanacetum cinerariifolium]
MENGWKLKNEETQTSSFDHCLKNLEKMLKMCEETNLVLNWEKCHFIVKEGTVLGHKVSGSRIEVDKAKVETKSYEGVSPEMRRHKSFDNVTAAHQEDIM